MNSNDVTVVAGSPEELASQLRPTAELPTIRFDLTGPDQPVLGQIHTPADDSWRQPTLPTDCKIEVPVTSLPGEE